MPSFSPWGGLGEPGEACVKCGGNLTTLGAHAPMRGASPKKFPIISWLSMRLTRNQCCKPYGLGGE